MMAVRFRVRGKLAHFRRFYTNSSSLTYPIPPPTVVAGLLGAAMGLGRDEYIKTLGDGEYSIRPMSPWRTIFQTMNLLKVTNPGAVTGSEGHTQVPTQFLVPLDFSDNLCFEILFTHADERLVNRAAASLDAPVYPPYLGVAYCLASFSDIEMVEGTKLDRHDGQIYGALRVAHLDGFPRAREGQRILRDRFPIRLDPSRRIADADDLLLEERGLPLEAQSRHLLQVGDRVHALL